MIAARRSRSTRKAGDAVDEMTMSAARSRSSSSSRPAARPPQRLASSSAAVAVRLATTTCAGALGAQLPHGELAGRAGADDEHRTARERAEHLAGEVDGHRADRDRAFADGRLGAHAFAHLDRLAEEPVEDGTGAAVATGRLIGVLELGEDLRLADDERVEARGDAEEVSDRLVAGHARDRATQRVGLDPAAHGERPDGELLGGPRVGGQEVDLGAVAGRQHDRFAHAVARHELAAQARGLGAGQRETLAQLERRGLVGDAEHDKVHTEPHSTRRRPGSSLALAARELFV